MRLIDADDAIRKMESVMDMQELYLPIHFKEWVIDEVPTVEERKKGKWIGEPKDGIEAMFFKPKCSVCGFESAEVKNFCPNCGADMRGE